MTRPPDELSEAIELNMNLGSFGPLRNWLPTIIWECLLTLDAQKRKNLARKLIIGEGLPWKEIPTSSSGQRDIAPGE